MHIDHADQHRERREQQTDRLQAEGGEHAVEHPRQRRLRPENDHPGVNPDQEVAGERQDHQQHQQVAVLFRTPRDQPGHRIGHDQADQRRGCGHREGAQEDFGKQEIAGKELVVLQGDAMFAAIAGIKQRRQAAEFAGILERGQHHDQCRRQEEGEQEQRRRRADRPARGPFFASLGHSARRPPPSSPSPGRRSRRSGRGRARRWAAAPPVGNRCRARPDR